MIFLGWLLCNVAVVMGGEVVKYGVPAEVNAAFADKTSTVIVWLYLYS